MGAAASEARQGVQGAVPGVELLAVGECPHVVVAHEVAAAHGARALVRHEAPLDLQLRVEAQARHGRRLPGHPEQEQQQRRRRGPPAPSPECHQGWRGERRGASAARSAEPARECGAPAARVGAGRAAAFANVEKTPGPPRAAAATPSPTPRPPATSVRGEEPQPRALAGVLRPALPGPGLALPGPAPPCPALRAGPPREEGWQLQREPVPEGETVNSSGRGSGPKLE